MKGELGCGHAWLASVHSSPQPKSARMAHFPCPLSYPHRACLSAKVDTCLQVLHYSTEMGTSTNWEDRCPALREVQDKKLGCSEQDQPLSCSRLLLQERCLTKVSQRQTHLPHLPRPEADRPPWEHPQAQGQAFLPSSCSSSVESCPPKAVLPYQ